MAEEVIPAAEPSAEPESSQDFGFASEGDLAKVFQDSGTPSPLDPDPEAESLEAKKEEQPDPTTPLDDPRIAQLEEKAQQQNDRLIAAETRANILQSRLAEIHPAGTPAPPTEEQYSIDKFREEVAKD